MFIKNTKFLPGQTIQVEYMLIQLNVKRQLFHLRSSIIPSWQLKHFYSYFFALKCISDKGKTVALCNIETTVLAHHTTPNNDCICNRRVFPSIMH